jgi:Dyp-type peroxidase family
MRRDLVVKTRTLAGSSDLTLLAPIRRGLIPSLESVTYKTRVKRLLAALNTGRTSAHEYSLLRAFSDAVERVGRIHSVRVAVIEPQDLVLLAVTFDGPWDSYIRVLWQKVGALLDVIFCNTEAPDGTKYVSAYDHTFEEWLGWARRVQIETDFFYGTPGITLDDVRYLKRDEWLHREHPPEAATDLAATQYALPPVESLAWETVAHGVPEAIGEAAKMGFQTLAGLYRLTDLYPPRETDGKYLHRAARELLIEFVHMLDEHLLDIPLELVGKRFEKQLDWLIKTKLSEPHGGPPPVLGDTPDYTKEDVQGGILHGYPGTTHGCLLFIAFDDAASAAAFLACVVPQLTSDAAKPQPGELVRNLAFTYEGLRAAGLLEQQLAWFPQEFREGMEMRAGVLGDYRINHPRRWRLPVRNWPAPARDEPERIELSAAHAVLQLRVGTEDEAKRRVVDVGDPGHPLRAEVERLEGRWGKARLLAIQPMRRYPNANDDSVEHFGFVDGISQPHIEQPKPGTRHSDQVHLGEILLGYANESDPEPVDSERTAFLRNGSFLVVRKLYQDVEALDVAVASAAEASGMQPGEILAKMMGRRTDGTPLVPSVDQRNDFDYRLDPNGSKCPFHAHIRRTNPRGQPMKDPPEQPGGRTPRLMRRGMSYGPRYKRNPANDEEREANKRERGVVFMAYNASIAEQFEVIQRWVNGGNSTGGFSGQSDPFLGVAANKLPRVFRFENNGATVRVTMDGWDGLVEEPRPLVRLEWGAYLFTPSFTAMEELYKIAKGAPDVTPAWSVEKGERLIEDLLAIKDGQAARKAWKIALEDSESQRTYLSASIWAAIREKHHGALDTPYGVLVARHDLVMKVLGDDRTYSVDGAGDSYRTRMDSSIGEIYLGYDASNPKYAKQSADANAKIEGISEKQAFKIARKGTGDALDELKEQAYEQAKVAGHQRWELTVDLREILDKVFATLCDHWFGVLETDKKRFMRGGTRGTWEPGQPPFYPGNFTAPSRYIFQPNPGKTVIKFGREYGIELTKAMELWIEDHRSAGTRPNAPVGDAIFGPDDKPTPTALAACTLVGVMMGFLPPADGNLRLTMNEWLREGTFWSLRARNGRKDIATYKDAMKLIGADLCRAMQLRPSPELVWRTATQPHDLDLGRGNRLSIKQGQMVVVSVVSATQQCLAGGSADVSPIFGGNRAATPHPTHACPAYKYESGVIAGAAFGVIAGVLAGLLERKESIRPGVAPGALVLEGPMPPKPAADLATQVAARQIARQRQLPTPAPAAPKCRLVSFFTRKIQRIRAGDATKVLLSWGDSWFHYKSNSTGATNITKYLLSQKYEFPVKPLGGNGAWLSEMAAEIAADSSDFLLELKNMLDSKAPPRAILLSGGGNDVVKTTLGTLLRKKGDPKGPINDTAMDAKIGGELLAYYETILKGIKALTGGSVPVLVHPYCHPIPDGRISPNWPESRISWLYPSITTLMGWHKFQDGVGIMTSVIDKFEAMQQVLRTKFPEVVVVPSMKSLDPFVQDKYETLWENELHPNIKGFSMVGKVFADTIAGLP